MTTFTFAPKTKKATILFKGGLGNVIVKHVYLLAHGRKKYAQYASAPFVHYVEKGKRKPTGFVQTFRPYLVILDGWQEIESQSLFRPATLSTSGALVSEGKFASCDDGWQKEFENETGEFKNVIADYREVNAYQPLELIAD